MKMHLILGLTIGFLGALQFGMSGVMLGVLVGILAAEILSLRKRLDRLEKSRLPDGEMKTRGDQDVVLAPPAAEPAAPRQNSGNSARLLAVLKSNAANLRKKIGIFFTSGNLVLKTGVIILFFGVAFLLKYAAQRNMIPLEMRLVGVAISGLGMLGVGWWLKKARAGYSLVLQGAGVGVLYLVVFAAAKLYGFLPVLFSLGLMIALVSLSCMLAVLQASRSLAVFGIVGGFLAPVLMSAGGGNHVLLFAYYALLNAGILGIAWFKSWRELNLLGFVFTFALGTLWGSNGYQPEYFYSTEPFLGIFFVFYVLISILFAHRQPVNLRGFIDGPLVFGLPLVVSGLQYMLVKDFPYGMAFTALALGLFYLTLAIILWRRLIPSMRLLCEAFLALGVVFGSLAIPLALDGHWSASIWALEGAGMVWVGGRQHRLLARHFGLLLQLAAAFIFVDSVWYPVSSVPFANQYFLGCLFLSLAAIFSSYFLDSYSAELKKWERYFAMPFMILGLIWWYIGGAREVDKQISAAEMENGFLLYCCASSILMGMVLRRLDWPRFRISMYLLLPAMALLLAINFPGFSASFHLLSGWGAVAWTVAFVVQYRILYLFAGVWPQRNMNAWHLGTMWLLLFILSSEGAWAVSQMPGLGPIWTMSCWALIPSLTMLLLMHLGKGLSWPVGKYRSTYLGPGGTLPAFGLVLWILNSYALAGDPAPLTYLALFNPVELSGLIVIITLVLWLVNLRKISYTLTYLPEKVSVWGLALLFFFWVNSVVARSVHFFVGIPYHFESLYRSVVFQAAIAALWGFGSLAITIWAARKGSRTLWSAGAVLLGMAVLKLFVVDLSGTGTIARIVSFLVVGGLMLIIGYFSPLPPKREEKSP